MMASPRGTFKSARIVRCAKSALPCYKSRDKSVGSREEETVRDSKRLGARARFCPEAGKVTE
jgi:hypothetical protein